MLSPNIDLIRYFLSVPEWDIQRPWTPQRCVLTGKMLWLRRHYKVKVLSIYEADAYIWVDMQAGTAWRLTN